MPSQEQHSYSDFTKSLFILIVTVAGVASFSVLAWVVPNIFTMSASECFTLAQNTTRAPLINSSTLHNWSPFVVGCTFHCSPFVMSFVPKYCPCLADGGYFDWDEMGTYLQKLANMRQKIGHPVTASLCQLEMEMGQAGVSAVFFVCSYYNRAR